MEWAFTSYWISHRLSKFDSHFSLFRIPYAIRLAVDEVGSFYLVPQLSLMSGYLDWSFSSVFDRRMERSCLIARSSRIRVELPDDDSYTLSPEPTSTESNFAIFNTLNSKPEILFPPDCLIRYTGPEPLDIAMQWDSETTFAYRKLI